MTDLEKKQFEDLQLTQARTSENLNHVSTTLDKMAKALVVQGQGQQETAIHVKYIKETIDSIPSIVAIQKDVESLMKFKSRVITAVTTLGVTSLVGFVAFIFNALTGK